MLKESTKEVQTQPLARAREGGLVGQAFIQRVAQIPSNAQPISGHCQELLLRANTFKEHHELERKEDYRVNGRATSIGVAVFDPIPYEREVERGFQVAIKVVFRNQILERDEDGGVQCARLDRTEHGGKTSAGRITQRVVQSTLIPDVLDD